MTKKADKPVAESAALDNMRIWDTVCKTDPAMTKKVEYGSHKFTAICAYSQIEAATRLWGPVGIGWGWVHKLTQQEGFWLCEVTLWYGSIEHSINVFGTAPTHKKTNVDDDGPKKALTDGITKALSYLGFSADVFQGQFDDNKYVAQRRAEVAAENGNGHEDPVPEQGEGPAPPSKKPETPEEQLDWFIEHMGLLSEDRDAWLKQDPGVSTLGEIGSDVVVADLLAEMRERYNIFYALCIDNGLTVETQALALRGVDVDTYKGNPLLAQIEVWRQWKADAEAMAV